MNTVFCSTVCLALQKSAVHFRISNSCRLLAQAALFLIRILVLGRQMEGCLDQEFSCLNFQMRLFRCDYCIACLMLVLQFWDLSHVRVGES